MGCTFSGNVKEPERASWAKPTSLDQSLTKHFLSLSQNGKVQAEYVWMDSDYMLASTQDFDLCSKSLTLDGVPKSIDAIPVWNYGGDEGLDVKLAPRRIYQDPFRLGDNIIVLADTYVEPAQGSVNKYGAPTHWNTRHACDKIMKQAESIEENVWFGIEQEYYLMDVRTMTPLGWPDVNSRPDQDESFYCQVGATRVIGRDIVEAHYRACLYAGVKIGGTNSEEEPSQWEYQVGPCSGIVCADDMWMSRYLLQRICEMYGVGVSFDPKPVPGRAGIGCHTNYSTKKTRKAPGGMAEMLKQIECLRLRHEKHMQVYGKDNDRRMTGKDHTASMTSFSHGIGDRFTSVRINVRCATEDCGYYEDRRPAANMDPYLVCGAIVETTLFYDQASKGNKEAPTRRASHRNSKKHRGSLQDSQQLQQQKQPAVKVAETKAKKAAPRPSAKE